MGLGFNSDGMRDPFAYARRALDDECAVLASTGHGRNDQVNRSGFALGQFIPTGYLSQHEVEHRIMAAAEASGIVRKDGVPAVRASMQSGIQSGMRQPRDLGRGEASSATVHVLRPKPQLSGVDLPAWTEPGEDGKPKFIGLGQPEPMRFDDEVRRHVYRRDGEAVRVKTKNREGRFANWFRVRRPSDGAVGWQARKPVEWVDVPYVPPGAPNPFDPERRGELIAWPEGEKDADTLAARRWLTFTFGGTSDCPDLAGLLEEHHVVIMGDNDVPGEKAIARKVEAAIQAGAASVKVVRFPELSEGGDVSDYLAAGGDDEGLLDRAETINPAEWQADTDAQSPPTEPDDGQFSSNWFEEAADRGPTTTFEVCPKPAIIRPTDLQGLEIPPRQWLVRDWAPWGSVTGLYGEGGLGKTLLAQQLQTAAALGRSWIGLDTTPVRSLAVYCEDSAEELWRRQADIDAHYGCDFRDLDDAVWMPRLGEDNVLIRFAGRGGAAELTPFHGRVIEAARDHRAQFVVVDTVSDTFGGNENDRGQVRQYVSWCLGTIAREIGGSVLCCAHPSRAGISSGDGDGGSTGWSAAFRSRLSLHMPPADDGAPVDPDARVLTRKKANYAARSDAVPMHWRSGALVPDTVFGQEPRLRRSCVDMFMLLLDALDAEGRPVSDTRNASNYAPRMFGRRPERDGYREKDFVRAMEELFAGHTITMQKYGRRSDLRRKIVRCGGSR